MINEKGEVKTVIFFISLMLGIICTFLFITSIGEINRYREKNEELTDRVNEQKLLIEYLQEEE